MPAPMPLSRTPLARQALGWIAALTALNLAFNLLSGWSGHLYPYTTFLWRPDDNFGDFFSLLSTYPGGALAVVHDRVGLHAILPPHPLSLTVASDPPVTNFHMMPLSTAIDLGLVALLRWIDPVILFLAVFAALLAGWAGIAARFAASRREAACWFAAVAISYPMLMTLARGNLFAGATALLLVAALLLGQARRAPLLSAMLLALACNFRPNAILLVVPLLVFYWPQRWRFAVALGATGLAALAISLTIATALYPAYTPAAIRAGVGNYYTLYVTEGWGLAYGSSLFGVLRLLVGLQPGLNWIALAVSLTLLGSATVARLRGHFDDAMLVFAAVASYCLGSTVFGDYHLLVWIAVPMAMAAAARRPTGLAFDPADVIVARLWPVALGAACLMLSPKNYLFIGSVARPISLQVTLNPMIMLGAAVLLFARRYARPEAASAGAAVPA